MWLGAIVELLAIAAMAPQAVPEQGTSDQGRSAAVKPVATRRTLFAVPYRIDRADQPSREPLEVQLYVSGDRGATWQLYHKVDPGEGYFLFRAGCDGEFWFIVRTLDRSGQLRPQGPPQPGLRVIVDTMLPRLKLDARQGEAGQVTAQWEIDEPHLLADSLTLQYRTTPQGPWQALAIERQNVPQSPSIHSGEVTWYPKAAAGEIQVRAEVSDLSGNRAVSHASIRARQQAERVVGTGPPASTTEVPRTAQVPPAIDTSAPWRPGSTRLSHNQWPARQSTHPLPAHPRDTQAPPPSSIASDVNPPVSSQYSYAPPIGRPATPAVGGLPAGERPRMVNARLFELEYDLGPAGSMGVSSVELWGTRDGGRTWKSYTLDNDNRSPIVVNVDGEGIYGFKVVVRDDAGTGGDPPRPGDLPEIFVGVDLTEPNVRITGARQEPGSRSTNLAITWEANESMLGARPVSLSFSETPAGPWVPIASGLENTGRYVWPIGPRVPRDIYLRLEVRDEAGNVGTFESTRPTVIERPTSPPPDHAARPSARISSVRPLGQSARKPPKRYYFR